MQIPSTSAPMAHPPRTSAALGSSALVWKDLMSRYITASAVEADYAARVHDPMFEDDPCTDTEKRKAVAAEMERLAGIRFDLLHGLLGVPAPHRAALLWKLEYLFADKESYCWSDATIAPIQRDLRRLLGDTAEDAAIFHAGTPSESIARSSAPDSQIAPGALTAANSAFDPAEWLAAFEGVGGGWMVRDSLSLVIRVEDQSDEAIIAARLMVNCLTPEYRKAIVEHLREREA